MHTDEETTKDYYVTLQIAATLPVIEDYQDKHIDGRAVESIAKESAILNKTTKKLAETYEGKLK